MSRMIWVLEGGHCGALVCVASDREEAMDRFREQHPEFVSFFDEADDEDLKHFELDEVVKTVGYEP